MAQRRTVATAADYVRGLSAGVKANCWQLAEAAGHENPYRMQALLRTCRWRWEDLRSELSALALAWLPHDADDLIGPGIAFDETAQLKDGDATACVAPQHAGCTGHVENCVTTVYAVWVTTAGQARADFDVFMPERWEKDRRRRRAAGIPGSLRHKTRPQLAREQLERLLDVRMPARWIAFDEVCTRSSRLREACGERGHPYAGIAPRDFRITLPPGKAIKAEEALRDAVFERRSCGNGSKGPRYSDWALIATASPRRLLLIRRSVCRPDHVTFCICWAPQEAPATMTLFVSIAGRSAADDAAQAAASQADAGSRQVSAAAAAARARRARARVACAASLLRWIYSMVAHDTSWDPGVAAGPASSQHTPAEA